MAGDVSHRGNILLKDFLTVASKLEELGFTYYNGKVIVVDWQEG
jgi:hypothetical protein